MRWPHFVEETFVFSKIQDGRHTAALEVPDITQMPIKVYVQ
jgi:hypothetical protein